VTAEYVMEDFGKSILTSVQRHQGTTSVVEGKILNFGGSYGERVSEEEADLVPREALGRLPDLEYFGSFSGSRIVKGRIPLIKTRTVTV
jgi:conjugal transfer pilus assembly protein TraD